MSPERPPATPGPPRARTVGRDPDDERLDGGLAPLVLLVALGPPVLAVAGAFQVHAGRLPLLELAAAAAALTAVAVLVNALHHRRAWAWSATHAGAATLATFTCAAAAVLAPIACAMLPLALLLGLTSLGLLRRGLSAVYARGRRSSIRGAQVADPGVLWTGYLGACLLVVGLAFTQHVFRRELGSAAHLRGDADLVLTMIGSVLGAGLIVSGVTVVLSSRAAARRDAARIAPAARARIFELRAAGWSLHAISGALAAEGHASPEGRPRFSGLMLRAVLRSEPRTMA